MRERLNKAIVATIINCELPQDILQIIENTPITQRELEFKNELIRQFIGLGYNAIGEYPISYIRNLVRSGRTSRINKGRIDIFVSKDNISFGIEIDISKPKQKSLDKLNQFKYGGIIILRNPLTPFKPH